jgi:hypothetical protein
MNLFLLANPSLAALQTTFHGDNLSEFLSNSGSFIPLGFTPA